MSDHDTVILTQCFPPKLGGIETLMGGLADALAEAGRRVVVFADGAPHASDRERPYPVRRFHSWKPIRREWKAWTSSGALLSAERVFADSWKSLERARLRPRGVGSTERSALEPWVGCLAHGMEFPVGADPKKWRRIADAFAKADAVIANSRHTADQAEAFLSRRNAALTVATPPIAPQPEPDAEIRAALRARIGPADPLLVTLCRLEPRKGVDRVIKALPRLLRTHPDLRFAVAGGGEDRARLESLAAEGAVADRVAFLGRVSDAEKAALFAEASLFVMPARREGASVEGFGIVYLEAAWQGAPAVAGREGGAADAVRDGETGVICDGARADAVAEAVAQALDPEVRARMSAAAQAHARAQIWERRLADYLL